MSNLDHAATIEMDREPLPKMIPPQLQVRKTNADKQGSYGFRPDIQGLRALAILLVVGYHIGFPGLRGGFIGVDVFFVLSGYLISGILVEEVRTSGKVNLSRFYARRARRLLPAAILTIVATVALSALFSPMEQLSTSRTATATAAYVSNVWFMFKAADYFAPENETNPLLHTWSLGVEEQFYLVWPFVILIGLRGLRRNTSERRLIWLMSVVLVFSFAACVWFTRTHQPWAFFSSPTRAWEFALGGLASLVPNISSSRGCKFMSWLGLVSIVGGAVLISDKTPFPGSIAALPAAGTAIMLVSGLRPLSHIHQVLRTRVLQQLGEVSYSWYLWHWPVFATAIILWPGLRMPGRLLCATFSLGLAAITYVAVEDPIRHSRFLVARTRLSLALAGISAILVISFTTVSSKFAIREMTTSPQKEFARAAQDNTRAAMDGCINGFQEATPRQCTFGDVSSPHTVILFGDSHAAQWFPAVEEISHQRHWKLITFLKGSCPAARVHIYNPRLRRVEIECDVWRETVLKRITVLHPDLVVIANATGYIKGRVQSDGYSQLSVGQWATGIRDTLASLNGFGIATILLRDTPRPGFSVPMCLARAARHAWYSSQNCLVLRGLSLDTNVQQAELAATRGLPHVFFMDLTDLFCNSVTCEPLRDNVVVFKDSNHLTVRFAKTIAPALSQRLNERFLTHLEYPGSASNWQ